LLGVSLASLFLFYPLSVAASHALLVADLPGDSARLTAGSQGIVRVLVGGVPVVEHGKATGATPGVVLRSGRDTDTVTAR
jgi:N-acyl-D-aspartate/D-glutamate deacylase